MDVTDITVEKDNVTIYDEPSGADRHHAVLKECAALGQDIPGFDIYLTSHPTASQEGSFSSDGRIPTAKPTKSPNILRPSTTPVVPTAGSDASSASKNSSIPPKTSEKEEA